MNGMHWISFTTDLNNLSVKKILVLGGTGAMGGYLVDILSGDNQCLIDVSSRRARCTTKRNVTYIKGNARDAVFISTLLQRNYDVIVDFMNYDYDEFADRCQSLLRATKHYIWFSSCRVYADSPIPLTETSPRLLETSCDEAFLATNRYALRKARQEDLLKTSGFNNYTIVRPYITYSSERLQLGIYEKEQWLWRLLRGKSIVINKHILDKTTTMTHGQDVARIIAQCVANPRVYGQIVQIASDETMTWREVLRMYLDVLRQTDGISPEIYVSDHMESIDLLYEGGYNTIYDRVYNRCFSSRRVEELLGEKIPYVEMRDGIEACLRTFLAGAREFLTVNPVYEAYQDVLTGEMLRESDFGDAELFAVYKEVRKSAEDLLNNRKYLERVTL